MSEQVLYAGYAERIVTPPMGYNIPGYYVTRPADGIINELYVRATAFRLGEQKGIIIDVDALNMRVAAYMVLQKMIAERCGVPKEAIYIACTHSHTAFRIVRPEDCDQEIARIYMEGLFRTITDTAQFAFEDLAPATLLGARGEAKNLSHMRRFRMKDGSCKTNPGYKNRELVLRPEGTPDDELLLLRVRREGAKDILLVNFGLHPDGIGGTRYCADWPGYVCEILKGAFCGDVEVMMLNGAQGDAIRQNQMVTSFPKGPEDAHRVARGIVGNVLRIYDAAEEIPCHTIRGFVHTAKVGKNPFDPADLPLALEMRDIYRAKGKEAEELKGRKLNLPEACRIAGSLNLPDIFELPVSGLQLGDVALIGMPGEPFVEIGRQVKKDSPVPFTMFTCLTNGGQGYFPTADAFAEAGYERSASPFAHNIAEILIRTGKDILEEMAK